MSYNIDRWKLEKPEWFKIDMIPDEFLPQTVLEVEGGAKRERKSLKEIGKDQGDNKSSSSSGSRVQQVHPE